MINKLNFIQWRRAVLSQVAVPSALLLAASTGHAQSAYVFTTIAGTSAQGYTGDSGPANAAELSLPSAVALDSAHTLYIADELNQRIRIVSSSTQVISTPAGDGTAGYSGDKGKATAAELSGPSGVVVDPSTGNIYIADTGNSVIRMVTPADVITTVAGDNATGAGFFGDNGSPIAAQLNGPSALALDAAGNLYIADTGNNRVRKVNFSANTISTVAGTGNLGFSGDGFPAVNAEINAPRGLAFDAAGNLYIADSGNHRIRVVNSVTKDITTVAGNGTEGYGGDGGLATSAELNYPLGVAVDASGIFIADSQNFRIRMVSASTRAIATIAGSGQPGWGGDGYYATIGLMSFPSDLVVDPSTGNIYVADAGNNVVRLLTKVAAPIGPPLISPGGVIGASQFGQFTSVSPGGWIEIYGSSLALDSRSWRTSDFQGVNAPISLDGTSVTIGGVSAYVEFIAGGQLNVQVPSSIGTGPQRVVVTTSLGSSVPYVVGVSPLVPGLYAPALTNVGGRQYVWAMLSDGSLALPPGSVTGVTSREAKPGETIVMYGVGFGPVTPAIPAGQIVQQSQQPNTLGEPFHVLFGGVPAVVNFAGLAPNAVGLYQFNVVVPNIPNSDSVPFTFTLGSETGAQTLFTAVHN